MKKRRRKSCRSYGERDVRAVLEELGIKYTKEKTFDECRNGKGNLLRFDFFLPDYNLLIEYQGIHHYKPANKKYRAKIIHEKTVTHDGIKSQFCSSKSIELLCIPYWERQEIRDIIKRKLDIV
jgi:hypothetical protein